MANIRFKNKPQVNTPAGTEAIPCQRADNTDAYVLISTLTASIRNGMQALSNTASRVYATGSTSGQQALIPYSINPDNNAIAVRGGDGSLCANMPADYNTASAATLINKAKYDADADANAEYYESAFVPRVGSERQVYGTDDAGLPTTYNLDELIGGGGGDPGVPQTNSLNQIYGTDDAGSQTTYGFNDGVEAGTIAKRFSNGALRASTPEDWLGTGDDLVSRAFFDRARSDRIAQIPTEEAGIYELEPDADGALVYGADVAAFTIKLPGAPEDRAKHLTFVFQTAITTLTWTADDMIGFLYPNVRNGDRITLMWNAFGSGWVQVSELRGPAPVDTTDYWTPEDITTPPKVLVDADEALNLLTMATNNSRQIASGTSRFNGATYPLAGNGDCIINRKDHRFEGLRSITCAGGTGIMQVTGTAANNLARNKGAFTMGGFFAYLVDTGSSGTQVPFIYVGTPTVDSLRLSIGRASNELNGLRYGTRRLDADTATSYDAVGNMGTTPFFVWLRVNFVTGVTELWVNGALAHTGTTPTSGGNTSDTASAFVGIGASSSSGSNQCPIATRMFMFEDSWVADTTLRRIEGYYAHRDKMPDILVAGHTYRSARPVA